MRTGKVLLVMVAVLAMAGAAGAEIEPVPFVCTGEAYTVRDEPADLFVIDQTVSPFVFVSIRENMTGPFGTNGAQIGIQVNNLGYNSADGLLYAIAMPENNVQKNFGIIKIDSTGAVFPLGIPSGDWPENTRLLAGDVAPEGNIFYVNTYPSGTLYTVDLLNNTSTSLELSGANGGVVSVADWAVDPITGYLYGAEGVRSGASNAPIYQLNPNSGLVVFLGEATDLPVNGSGDAAFYGGAWFKFDGTFVVYRNNDFIYEIDLTGVSVSNQFAGGAGPSGLNDAAACALDPTPPCPVQTEPLCAGQTMDIGTVDVTNDDENLYVTFNIDTENWPGWYLDETHVAIGESLNDIPQTGGRNPNPIPGQFPYFCENLEPAQTSCTVTIPLDGWCAGTELVVAAHAAVVEVEGDGCVEKIFWANIIDSYDQGTRKDGSDVLPERSDPLAVFALGLPFFSLGFDLIADDDYADGWLRVGFGAPVYNGPGDDVVVQEITNGRSTYPLEQVEVFGVADDMLYSAGLFDNERNVPGGDGFVSIGLPPGPTSFDFIELLDATNPGLHNNNDADGYDVDAVGACYLVVGDETAWGDGCEGTRFTPRGNWGTYFTYTIGECAPCVEDVDVE